MALTQAELAEIKRELAEPSKTAADVATKAFLFGRYVPDLLAEVEAKEGRVGELEAQAKNDKQAINRVDNLCLEQNKRIKELEAVGRKLLRFKRKLKRTDPEAYERGKEALWDELETLLPDWDKSDQTPTDRRLEGDGG